MLNYKPENFTILFYYSFKILLAYGQTLILVWCARDADYVDGSVYSVGGLTLLYVVFCAYVFMLERFAQDSETLRRLKVFSAVVFLVVLAILLGVSFYIQQKFPVTDFIKVGCCGIFCSFICGLYLDWRLSEMQKLDFLKENRPIEYIRVLIKKKKTLNVDQQLKLFYQSDAEQLLYAYMQYEDLCPAAEVKLLEQPYAARLLKNLPTYSFSDEADSYMFRLANAPELVKIYVNNGNAFSPKNEPKMFSLPNAPEVVEIYISNHYLSDEGEVLLFELPNAEELVEYYLDMYDFDMSDRAYKMAEERGWV